MQNVRAICSILVSKKYINAIDKFIKKAMGLIDKYHVDSKYIIFEITENTYIPQYGAVCHHSGAAFLWLPYFHG